MTLHRPFDESSRAEETDEVIGLPRDLDTLPPPPPPDSVSRRRRRIALAIAVPVVAVLAFGTSRIGGGEAPASAMPVPQVAVATPLQRAITEYDEHVGRFEASQSVEIRPRVSGALRSIHFRDGDMVSRGQLLFTIDPRPFEAALAEAQARAAAARTAAALARTDLARAERLIADEAVSAQEVDSLRAAVRSADAAVAAAQAAIRARALDVEFTRVRAPISGRISDRRIDVGNLVAGDSAGSATLLTTIHALDPIHFSFDASESLYLKAQRERMSGNRAGQGVDIRLQDESAYRWRGVVDFTDNSIDPGSGTIRARAVLRNPGYFLTPGMFGNMRLGGGGTVNALLVPDSAVQTDQARKIVLVVGRDGKATARPVEVGAVIDGLRVIRSGLAGNERVIIRGGQNVMPGSPVTARPARITRQPQAAPQPAYSAPPSGQATFAS